MNLSASEQNYLKAIFHLQQQDETVSTNALAESLSTKPASVTDMMKRLDAKQLLHYKPYHGFTLSAEGKRLALTVVRRHRLWECFLADKLEFDWKDVHSLAEELEHVSSDKLIDRLDSFLGHPEFDPHGDPIPDNKGRIKAVKLKPLSELPIHQAANVARVTNQSAEMLDLLRHKQIGIGTKIEVRRHFDFDGSIEVKLKSLTTTISAQLAQNIWVR